MKVKPYHEDRWYQTETVSALWEAIKDVDCKPVVAVPTGAGKTHIMAMFIEKYLAKYPDNSVVVLAHNQEILEQDHATLQEFFPDKHIGIFSAGLGSKEIEQITVAGIQSAVNALAKFRWTNLFVIDEVHSVNHKKQGSYRKLLDESMGTLIGMSATVYRTGHGYIHKGASTLFNTLAYDLTSLENFNRLVEEGYLCRLVAVAPEMQLDSSKIKKTGGDYNLKDLAAEHDKTAITEAAIRECQHYGKKYKKWLVFAIDIEHANHICELLVGHGFKADVLHSRIKKERKKVIASFKQGDLHVLVSVGMVTTGFDAPNIDLIILLRPTDSTVLHVQMIGRGLRISPGKDHCLVLDFSGNLERLGPINNVVIPATKKEAGGGEAPTKKCPKCRTITFTKAKFCESCGFEFTFEVKLTASAGTSEVMANSPPAVKKWLKVDSVDYYAHKKLGKPDSVKVVYRCGVHYIRDWMCPEHEGYAGIKARHMLQARGYKGPPTARDVLKNTKQLAVPKSILVDFGTSFHKIDNVLF